MQQCTFTHSLRGFAAVLFALTAGCGGPNAKIEESLREHVVFFANFENGIDALYSAGSPLAKIDGERTHHHLNGGVQDGYITFEKNAGELSYTAKDNFPYRADSSWSGAVSCWLSVNPADLEADFPEPFHIGKRTDDSFPWGDAVIFIDFTRPPRVLRFGCYPDKTGEITDTMVNQRVIRVPDLSWEINAWHHLVITWSNINSGKADAEWAFYVDGVEKGRKKNLLQTLTWNMTDQVIRFNHYKYAGKLDEIAIFNKRLSSKEIEYLYRPKRPLNKLLKKDL